MQLPRPSLLLVTDLRYPARGRRYGDEDVWLSGELRERFDVALCSPLEAAALMDPFDIVLVRNSGPVIHHREAHEAFRTEVARRGTRLVNPLTGRGDMQASATWSSCGLRASRSSRPSTAVRTSAGCPTPTSGW